MEVECRFCKGKEVVKRGFRNNQVGRVRVYYCKTCGKVYSENTTFMKMKHKGEVILTALDLYTKNVSLRKIQDHLKQIHGVRVSHVTILKWIRKYSKIYKEYTDKLKANGSGTLHADEMMVNINGRWTWFWDAIDEKTRFITATHLSKVRELGDAKKIFYESKRKLNQSPEVIVTDGLHVYPRSITKVFGQWGVKHVKLVKFGQKPENNLIERFHGTIRERTKVMRGFDKFYSAKAILDLIITNYNFIRPHISLNGLTPAQASGINLPLNGGNRWLELLKLAIDSQNGGVQNDKREDTE